MPDLITGVVTDPAGSPVAGVPVALTAGPVPFPDLAVLTADDGTFTLGVPAPGEYRVAVHGSGTSAEATVTVAGRATVTLVLG